MILAGTTLLRAEQSNVEKIQKKNPEILFPSSLNLFQLSIRSDRRGHANQYFRGRVPALDSFLGQGIEIFTK